MKFSSCLIALCLLAAALTCASPMKDKPDPGSAGQPYRIMFYNTENLFDTVDDTLKEDEDFTAPGRLHWTGKRYWTKIKNLYKVMVALGGWQPPDVIGLCEIENRRVLEDITEQTPLSKYAYRIIHRNSADRRGIDVALLYNPKTVRYINHQFYSSSRQGLQSRDILCFKAMLGADTCHFLVNHWPSRSEGQLETERERFTVAETLKHVVDSLLSRPEPANIVIMGDFNDEPEDESLTGYLKAIPDRRDPVNDRLYNLSVPPASGPVKGTLKYQGKWNIFDQIIVSGSMLRGTGGLICSPDSYSIFREPYLLTEDKQYNGYKPYRTYSGFRYLGGFSDHLPVYIDIEGR